MSWWAHAQLHATVTSTMDVARDAADAGAEHGTTIVAREQTAGRGRRGRTWIAPRDAGVYLTTILRPGAAPGIERLSIVAGAAVCEALAHLGAAVQLKWPNDVVVGDRKLAGILLEACSLGSASPYVLVGIGINLVEAQSVAWPQDLRAPAVGLADLLRPAPAALPVAEAVVHQLASHDAAWHKHGLGRALDVWQRADALHGYVVCAQLGDETVTGRAEGLADDGALLLRTEQGLVRVTTGEVSKVRAQR